MLIYLTDLILEMKILCKNLVNILYSYDNEYTYMGLKLLIKDT